MNEKLDPNLEKLFDEAEAGDPKAQFLLARIVVKTNPGGALQMMEQSAATGLRDSLFFLGVWHTEGLIKPRELEKGLDLIDQAEEKGFEFATHYKAMLKAKGIIGKKDWAGAVQDIVRLAGQGNSFGLSQIGFLLRMTGEKEDREHGLVLLKEAAEKGNPEAKRLFNPDGPLKNVSLKTILKRAPGRLKEPPGPKISPNKIFDQPEIVLFEGMVPPEVCEYLISRALPGLRPSLSIDGDAGGIYLRDELRNSTEIRFTPFRSDLVIQAVCEQIVRASGDPLEQQEILGVLKYEPGQKCIAHSDFFLPDNKGRNPEVDRSGQRVKTFLIALRGDFEGGETDFPNLGYKFKGKKGEGIMFSNVDKSGKGDPRSVHASLPVTKGEKFITTLWIRDRKYTFPRELG